MLSVHNTKKKWRHFLQSIAALFLPLCVQAQMVTPGQFQVSESGAATYTIPIQVSPGVGGMEPKLSLNYSSQSGNGLLGMGWSLGGLGGVGRCPRTMAQDGVRGGVNYDSNDRYCLDGQRLIAINGSEGGDGTEYRTERESFAKIVSYSSAGNGPAWFKVWTKAGQVMEYGKTTDARIEAQGKTTIRVWALNRIEDTKGNYLMASYTKDAANGDYYPNRIDYTGNSKINTAPTNSVQFQYEARPDIVPMYQAGSLMRNAVRLKSLALYGGTSAVKTYNIAYQVDGAAKRSRISEVSECSAEVCRGKFKFDWSNEVSSFGSSERSDTGFRPADGWFSPNFQNRVWTVDVNGDGLPDVLGVTDGGFYWQLNTGSGFGAVQQVEATFKPSYGWFDPSMQNRVWITDVNGDGLPDILGATDSGLYWQLNTGAGFGPVQRANTLFTPSSGWFSPNFQNRVWIADVNGDGLPDILGATDSGLYWQLNTGSGFGDAQRANTGFTPSSGWFSPNFQNRVWIADVNGDGLPDILGATDSGLYWQLNTGAGFGDVQRADTTFTPSNGWFGTNIQNRVWIVDINGDGLPDILGATDGGLYWQLNTGSGFGPVQQQVDTTFKPSFGWFDLSMQNRVWIADVNGDGLPDILGATDSGLYWQLNTGTGFGPVQHVNTVFRPADGWFGTNIQGRVWITDVNGDGTSSILGATDGGLYWQRNTTASTTRPSLLTTVTDSAGAVLNIGYASVTNKSVYNKDISLSSYPIQDIQAPIYVVASVSSPNGVGGATNTRYTYGGLKSDLSGRGLLGFRWMQTRQVETGLTSYTEYQQSWPYTGLPSLVKKSLAGGGNNGVLSQITNSYNCNDAASTTVTPCVVGAGKRYFVYANQSVESGWDYNGAVLPVITTKTEYDTWGNATRVDVSTSDGYGKSTINSYANDSNNWYLGRLLKSSVTSATP
ncbi:FG-GAP-like repeat-containing protein [Herbaspirillum sp. RV1423]|uniref:FG-GAP-like repeat-containing protein n=1 Tax=Herbaspirillum sp. RV1423 TaxID=1443993 RepID=UPI0004B20D22|nr:FG-GAP-like repeat-containing protein [Herbaspirillum sp. RV1423]